MNRIPMLLAAGAVLVLSGCSKQMSSVGGAPSVGTMRVMMTDAPGSFDAVNLVVEEVAALHADTGTWEVLSSDPTTVDLLTLQNGTFMTLSSATVPSGAYSQIRLTLGEGSTVVVDGVSHPLTVPSGASSGLKLNGSFDVTNGGLFDVLIDFDAARSIHRTHDGSYWMTPVVRILGANQSGAITGQVMPTGVPTDVFVVQGADTVATTVCATTGFFKATVLPAGSYAVHVVPQAGYVPRSLNPVTVSAGSTTDLGAINLVQVGVDETVNPQREQ